MNELPKVAYRVDEAARLLGIHPGTVYELVWAGILPHKWLGRQIIIPASALEEWLNTPDPWASFDYSHRK